MARQKKSSINQSLEISKYYNLIYNSIKITGCGTGPSYNKILNDEKKPHLKLVMESKLGFPA